MRVTIRVFVLDPWQFEQNHASRFDPFWIIKLNYVAFSLL